MRFWLVSLILLALGRTTALYGQAGFVYYDVDLLYDTGKYLLETYNCFEE